ncbi:Plasmodium variant antigen protein Cir/Yir/Bir/Plasmodium vivax Vir protein, putative [Plasmodium chabaudi adami]|uniref:Plasmodium variant antigen protein Cir/Yir/Bir/Plasmodium vivax Vir protein, putative n=1 Tax=Plasmodium chabaudi adami TaxID=5826 RepID=A0A1C6WNF9_PLACE|nr:Plasmodium variant antigen protein Cir/Yir/Bir/Plasmodium vivax Vir protein, putative [Plasmodium chabaudi adami]
MNIEQVCNLFHDSDEYFNEKNIVNSERFNQDGRYDQYCHVKNYTKKCETNEHRIAAISTYLFMKLEAERNGDYGKYFLMWLSNILFKMVKDKDKGKENSITLNEAYDKYLKNNIGNFNYWHLLWNIRGLKDANLRHMRELYTLLKYICNTIADYRKKGANNRELYKHSAKCLNQYRTLYENISGCNSYLHLLDKLKKIYEDFRTSAINENRISKKNNLDKRLQKLTTTKDIDSYFATEFKEFNFKGSGCVKLDSKTDQEQQPQLSLVQSPPQGSQTEQSDQPVQLNGGTEEPSTEESSDDNGQQNETERSELTIQESSIDSTNIQYGQKTTSDNSEIGAKEIMAGTAYSGHIFNEYKIIVFSVIAIVIPVILAVMYKYLAPGLRKKFKKKQNMKKITNLCDEKKAKKKVTNAFTEKNQSE